MPIEKAEALCAGLPGCERVVVVPGAGHTTALENHQAVNEVLRSFVVKHS